MLDFASITDPIVNVAVDVVDAMGLWGVFILMVLESACIPVPSEATMLFAGFNVSDGEYSLFAAVAVGSFANLVGSWIAYAVGYYGRVDILEKHGKKLHIKKSHLEWADRWFEKHGDATVFFTRMLPIIRTFISLPAGVARMPFWRFSLLTLARLRAVGPDADLHRQGGRRQLGAVEGQPALLRLRRRRVHRRRRDLPVRQVAPRQGRARRRHLGRARGRVGLTLAQAAALGALQGPTELLPISSSGHTALVPRLLGWSLRASWTTSCASRSRWRCTSGPPRRC